MVRSEEGGGEPAVLLCDPGSVRLCRTKQLAPGQG